MESTDIGREVKVYDSLWNEGNESIARLWLPNICMYIYGLFMFSEQDEVSYSTHNVLTRNVFFQQ